MDRRLAERLGKAARDARERAHLTQADVAEQVGISEQVYGRMERGVTMPSVETLVKLCEALSISADALIGARSLPPPSLAEQEPDYGATPELRQLLRRARSLDRRAVKVLSLLARELKR